jgi:hypothetical protein
LRMRRTCTLARTVSCWWGTRSRYPGGMTGSPIRTTRGAGRSNPLRPQPDRTGTPDDDDAE